MNHEEWVQDDVLHLQRIVLEGRGIGPWDSKESEGSLPLEYKFEERPKGLYSNHETQSASLEPIRYHS